VSWNFALKQDGGETVIGVLYQHSEDIRSQPLLQEFKNEIKDLIIINHLISG
jgi:hypothetical protein